MKKNFKRTLASFLVVVMILCATPLSGFVGLELPSFGELFGVKAEAESYSGTYGDIIWSLDTYTGVLTISGTGAIPDGAFSEEMLSWTPGLIRTVLIEYGITSIGYCAFFGCSKLSSVTIPNSVTSIAGGVFYGCQNLRSITIPDSVTDIDEDAFMYCQFLNITVDQNNKHYLSEDGALFTKDKTVLLQYPIGKTDTSYTICNGVVNIGGSAFWGCTKLSSVTIPISVTNISKNAFLYSSIRDVYYQGTESDREKISIGTNNDSLLSATWHYNSYAGAEISYTINFYDGDNLLGSKTLKLDEDGTLSYGKIPSKEGYKFVGWSSVKGGPALYNDGMAIKNLATENGAVVNYYAVWSKISVDTSEADDDTGVIVDIPADTYDGEVTLEVEEILSGSSFNIVNSMNGAIASKVFSIETYVNGEKVQPNGYVTVRIPIPDGYKPANCAIYYINTQSGIPETVPFTVENGYFVFKTNHFSDWAIVEMGEKTVVSLTVTAQPSVSRYKYGIENLDTTGLEITATYSDGTTAVIDNSEVELTGFDTSTRGVKTITATYEGCTATFDIEVYYTFWQWLLYLLCFGWIWM